MIIHEIKNFSVNSILHKSLISTLSREINTVITYFNNLVTAGYFNYWLLCKLETSKSVKGYLCWHHYQNSNLL